MRKGKAGERANSDEQDEDGGNSWHTLKGQFDSVNLEKMVSVYLQAVMHGMLHTGMACVALRGRWWL